MFRKITQTYKHTPPPPPPPSTPQSKGGPKALPPFGGEGGGGGVGWGGGGVRSYVCVTFRNINRETVSIRSWGYFPLLAL